MIEKKNTRFSLPTQKTELGYLAEEVDPQSSPMSHRLEVLSQLQHELQKIPLKSDQPEDKLGRDQLEQALRLLSASFWEKEVKLPVPTVTAAKRPSTPLQWGEPSVKNTPRLVAEILTVGSNAEPDLKLVVTEAEGELMLQRYQHSKRLGADEGGSWVSSRALRDSTNVTQPDEVLETDKEDGWISQDPNGRYLSPNQASMLNDRYPLPKSYFDKKIITSLSGNTVKLKDRMVIRVDIVGQPLYLTFHAPEGSQTEKHLIVNDQRYAQAEADFFDQDRLDELEHLNDYQKLSWILKQTRDLTQRDFPRAKGEMFKELWAERALVHADITSLATNTDGLLWLSAADELRQDSLHIGLEDLHNDELEAEIEQVRLDISSTKIGLNIPKFSPEEVKQKERQLKKLNQQLEKDNEVMRLLLLGARTLDQDRAMNIELAELLSLDNHQFIHQAVKLLKVGLEASPTKSKLPWLGLVINQEWLFKRFFAKTITYLLKIKQYHQDELEQISYRMNKRKRAEQAQQAGHRLSLESLFDEDEGQGQVSSDQRQRRAKNSPRT